jgi:carbamate kinase
VYPIPLALCVADTQAGMGFMICECIRNEMLGRSGRGRSVQACTVITTVRVDPDDEAFGRPSKPIGQRYDAETARERADTDGWDIVEVEPGVWRRVVASPRPVAIEEIELIRHLFDEGRLVVCCGGGGIPVVQTGEGRSHSVEAVVDKDLTASLLAIGAEADTLLILTDVERVLLDRGSPRERAVGALSVAEAEGYLAEGQFGEGSMEPKIRACVEFIARTRATSPMAVIARTDRCVEALAGRTGTRVVA